MLDIKMIRERPDFVRQRLASRGAGDEVRVDEILRLDEQRRKLLNEVETLKAQRNRASKEIGALMQAGKRDEAEAKKSEVAGLKEQQAALEAARDKAESAMREILINLPNIPAEDVPVGLEGNRVDNPPRQFAASRSKARVRNAR